VGIGLLPATAYNPLFAAMEITTLAGAFPGRFLPGFGHGVSGWMDQIGARPRSSLNALEETVAAVRKLLRGELVNIQGEQVKLDRVQMQLTAAVQPPIFIGAMREKTLQLAGRMGDGTILTAMSSPEYVRWAVSHIRQGMDEAGRGEHRVVVYLDVKVNPDGKAAGLRQSRHWREEPRGRRRRSKRWGSRRRLRSIISSTGWKGRSGGCQRPGWSVCGGGDPEQAAASIRRASRPGRMR